MGQSRRYAVRCRTGFVLVLACLAGSTADVWAAGAGALTFGGDLTAVTDYIFRGVSQNDGRPAAQFDLHAGTNDGLFAGVWGSTLNSREPRANFELDVYVAKRFALSSAWSATLTASDYAYLDRPETPADDYQEVSVALAYLDTWNVSLSASPNAVHYWRGFRLGRYFAYDADVTIQWPVFGSVLGAAARTFLTAGAGYYYLTGPSLPQWGTQGYPYGNAGLALERNAWRLDVAYYVADRQAERLFPYSFSNNRIAATLSRRF